MTDIIVFVRECFDKYPETTWGIFGIILIALLIMVYMLLLSMSLEDLK